MTREEIIRNLKYTMKKHKNDNIDTFGTNISVMCRDILNYLEQEPDTGHWIKYGELYQCSECKELSCCQGKFCNECGARMKRKDEE